MQTALSSKRSWIARIAVLAMVASLMAIAAPAGAAIDTSDACPASITDTGPFTDLAGVPDAAVDAINCIAEYGISTGTTATTFDPFADVARWQMALFLTRQAEIHGVTLPDGSDQGFNDLAGVPAAAVTAINQTAQLNISDGTSASTFDPFADVERWQMALFLTRLVDAAGVTLPDGADQGFTDLAGVPATAVTAINQLAQLDISDGTTATTYDPFASVERWAMALFLARTLAADGITPAVTGDISVTPTDAVTIIAADPDDTTDDRQYTATGLTDGTTYLINLFDPSGIDTSGSSVVVNSLTPSTEAQITVVNGAAITAAASASTQPVNGTIAFTVDAVAGSFGDVVPVVWVDSDGDTMLDLDANDVPTEPFGIGGVISVFPEEASNGASVALATDVLIDGADRDANIIVAGGAHWVYDANDRFYIDANNDDTAQAGEQVTLATFEAALSPSGGDEIGVLVYFTDEALVSEWVLTDLVPVPPTSLSASDTGANSTTITVNGVASGASMVTIHGLVDPDPDSDPVAAGIQGEDGAGAFVDADAVVTASSTVYATSTSDADSTLGGWQVVVSGLSATTTYDFAATQTVDGETTGLSPELQVTTLAVGETTQPTIEDLTLDTDAGTAGLLDTGDIIDFGFSEEMQAPTSSWLFRISDADSVYQVSGTVATPALFDAATSTDTNDGHAITLTGDPIFISGVANGIDLLDTNNLVAVQGFRDAAGNSVDLAGSSDTVLD